MPEIHLPSTLEGPPFPSDLDHALWAISYLFEQQGLPLEEVARDGEGLVLFVNARGGALAVHLRATRWDPKGTGLGPVPALLTEMTRQYAAVPLQLRVNLKTFRERAWPTCFGEEAFRAALCAEPKRWQRPMDDAWLERAGGLSTLKIRIVRRGWPYALINGKPVSLPKHLHWSIDDPPLDPGELCRSVTSDGECMLFTCECSEPLCGGIEAAVQVDHDGGLVVWRNPEAPALPLGVFEASQYRKVIFAALETLLVNPPKYSGLNWGMAISPENLGKRLARAKAGEQWTRS